MADIEALKGNYRLLATATANGGATLAGQRTWLFNLFVTRATDGDAGGFQPSSTSFEGGSFSGLFRGSSSEERAQALRWAIEEIDREIAAVAAGTVTPAGPSVLIPRIVCAPR